MYCYTPLSTCSSRNPVRLQEVLQAGSLPLYASYLFCYPLSSLQVGGFPRKAGMERKDVMSKNVTIYRDQAAAIEKHASKDVKVRGTRGEGGGRGGS